MEEKICTYCHKSQPITLFGKNPRSKGGYKVWCKPCSTEYMKKYRVKNNLASKERDYMRVKRIKDGGEDVALAKLQKAIQDCRLGGFAIPENILKSE